MKRPRWRLGVAGRLAAILGGLATASTLVTLLLQDRALNADLEIAAHERLARSADAADRLLADYLRGVADRYAAISRTPEFRANLTADHGPTLTYYAVRLAQQQNSAAAGFVRRDGSIAAGSRDGRLIGVAAAFVAQPPVDASCVPASGSSGDDVVDDYRVRFVSCRYPAVAEASLMWLDSSVYVVAAVPLRTGGSMVGGLVALESVRPDVVVAWSEIIGATVEVLPLDQRPAPALQLQVTTIPGAAVWATTTYQSEQDAIARSRRNLAASALFVLIMAVAAAALLARGFARPILAIRRAAARAEAGVLDTNLDVQRTDELGDLGRAFTSMVSRLRGNEFRLGRAQRLAQLDHWSFDAESGAVEAGAEFRRLFRLAGEGTITLDTVVSAVHGDDRERFRAALRKVQGGRGSFKIDVRVPIRPGRDRLLHVRGRRRADVAGDAVDATVQDVTQRWRTAKRIQYLSLHDPLTGLGNREYFRQHLHERTGSHEDGAVAVLTVGLNDFPSITGAMGVRASDRVIKLAAERIGDWVRATVLGADAETGLPIMRLGDAEFAVVLPIAARAEAAVLAEQLLSKMDSPFLVGDDEIRVDASIGICLWPDDATDVDTLIRNSLTALEQGRLMGRQRFQFYHGLMHREAARRLRIANLLRRAIEHGELEVHYQPRVRPGDGALVAVEALARWNSGELGWVAPSEFVPVAEEAGLVQQLGDWCLRVAVADLARWRAQGMSDLRVAVNMSRHQLKPGIVKTVLAATHGIDPTHLEFEVTESAVIDHGDETLGMLRQLGEQGFRISLDDFGTGYSSLSYIRELPIDAVKIDRSFVRELATSEDARSIIWAIVTMCQALKLESVAEGVETQAQCRRLIDLGCDEAQGFLFARPMPAGDLEAFVRERRGPRVAALA